MRETRFFPHNVEASINAAGKIVSAEQSQQNHGAGEVEETLRSPRMRVDGAKTPSQSVEAWTGIKEPSHCIPYG